MKVLFYGIVFLIMSSATAYPITYEQMMNLKGANILGIKASILLEQFGLPSQIIDQGVIRDMPRKKNRWGRHELELTDGDWNFVYTKTKFKKEDTDARYWVNTNPTFPREFSSLSQIVFLTAGKRIDLIYDEKQKKYITKAPKTVFEGHEVIGLVAFFTSWIADKEITTLYGLDYEKTRDTALREVIRYSLVKRGYSDYPEVVYQVDFFINGYSVIGYNISLDYKKWSELVDNWLRENREKLKTAFELDKAQPPVERVKE